MYILYITMSRKVITFLIFLALILLYYTWNILLGKFSRIFENVKNVKQCSNSLYIALATFRTKAESL